jgi:hypothetical protein
MTEREGARQRSNPWMAGTRPAMTISGRALPSPNLNAFVITVRDCVEASRPSYIG